MANSLNHQKTIGIVGSNPDAHEFILEANRLGFITYQLCQTEEEIASSFGADKEFYGAFDDERIQEDFLMHCDLLVYFDYSLNSRQIEEARKAVVIPQGDDLLSISRDRALQKAFKESLSVNIAPYETVLTSEDIKEGLRSIGYPAVLRTNYLTSSNKDQSFFIYDEEDIEEASKLLKYGTCVLESWIVTDEELSISLVKTASGAIETYPVVKKSYRNDRLSNVQTTAAIDQDLLEEIERVSRILAEGIQFIGAITIDFVVSPAQALYVGNIYPFPNELSRYSQKNRINVNCRSAFTCDYFTTSFL
ncbi:5-(carboxyamino)imidazole ribonucleotide synthase [Atopostipes suicloacalis DSM 15692]|uniref:5-(Carboxyamino)imidazole ribonucleotide synthase n=1 Tax=Atopostipes suicloacalis DSM 15692 TaxID=1121025 RepID=A0A1M4U6I3_9LACT|nr:ATP-grasp domain-containing protein [Atopostipes suicloacalis]SHE52187.1 5-(carboxyamino)imidazole ribonucleotide synthase [Atopostipes suicloacalis DSM 15692]